MRTHSGSPLWLRSWRRRAGSLSFQASGALYEGMEMRVNLSFQLLSAHRAGRVCFWWRRIGAENTFPLASQASDKMKLNMSAAGLSTETSGWYSHRVWSPTAVPLLADDGCAEVLGVGERESVKCLRWREHNRTKRFTLYSHTYKWIYTQNELHFPRKQRWGCYGTEGQWDTCLALRKVTRSFQAEGGTPQGLLIAVIKHCGDKRPTIRLRAHRYPRAHTKTNSSTDRLLPQLQNAIAPQIYCKQMMLVF